MNGGDRGEPAGSGPLRIAMIGLRGIPASYGGVERAVEELSAGLADRGHEVTVYARRAYSDVAVREHRGVKVIHLAQIDTKHGEAASHTLLSIGHAVLSRKFDVVHLHATGPGALAPLVRLGRIPAVVTIQGLDWRREKWNKVTSAALRFAARIAGTRADRTIVVSRELQRHFADEYGAGTVYIPNGVAPVPPAPAEARVMDLEPDGFVLFLGRLVPEKHVHTLISAYEHVDTQLPLVIAGPDSHSPDYEQELKTLAERDPRVKVIGPQYGEAKDWLMQNALAFVQPSSIEGLPIALLEALSAGAYPIVSNIPENLEPVTIDGEHLGQQVPVGDPHALADAIGRSIAASDRREVGARLAEHVRTEYDWAHITAAVEEVYRAVTRGRR
jgi:glycosyltransferase involved in cell wall biosynthesis